MKYTKTLPTTRNWITTKENHETFAIITTQPFFIHKN